MEAIMEAAVFYRYGAPSVFQMTEVERPKVEPEQMLMKVLARSDRVLGIALT
jgi:NADPH:quinone reductase-like Zn-dependent oxidoreductase